jgi:hypothetical protein
MAKIIWKENDIVRLKLRNDLYTIGQLLVSPFMRFYMLKQSTDEWKNIDLNDTEELFTVLVTNHVFQGLATGKVKDKTVKPSLKPLQRKWIEVHHNIGEWYEGKPVFLGGKLVELEARTFGPNAPTTNETMAQKSPFKAPTLIFDLKLPQHRPVMESVELSNMWSADSLSERLVRCFDKGIDRDDLKFMVFPGLYDDIEQLRPLTSRVPIPFR